MVVGPGSTGHGELRLARRASLSRDRAKTRRRKSFGTRRTSRCPSNEALYFARTRAPLSRDTRARANLFDQPGVPAIVGASRITCGGCQTGIGLVGHERVATP